MKRFGILMATIVLAVAALIGVTSAFAAEGIGGLSDDTLDVTKTLSWGEKTSGGVDYNKLDVDIVSNIPEAQVNAPNVLFLATTCAYHGMQKGTNGSVPGTIESAIDVIAQNSSIQYYVFTGRDGENSAIPSGDNAGFLDQGEQLDNSNQWYSYYQNYHHGALDGFVNTLYYELITRADDDDYVPYDYVVLEFDSARLAWSSMSGLDEDTLDAVATELQDMYDNGRVLWLVDQDKAYSYGHHTSANPPVYDVVANTKFDAGGQTRYLNKSEAQILASVISPEDYFDIDSCETKQDGNNTVYVYHDNPNRMEYTNPDAINAWLGQMIVPVIDAQVADTIKYASTLSIDLATFYASTDTDRETAQWTKIADSADTSGIVTITTDEDTGKSTVEVAAEDLSANYKLMKLTINLSDPNGFADIMEQDATDPTKYTVNPNDGEAQVSIEYEDSEGYHEDTGDAEAQQELEFHFPVSPSKIADKLAALPGETITYMISVDNDTASDVVGVTITDELDPALTLVDADNDGDVEDGVIVWSNMTVPANSSLVLAFKATVNDDVEAGTVIANRVRVKVGDEEMSSNETDTVVSDSKEVTVEKEWENGWDEHATETVDVQLYANDVESGAPVTLSATSPSYSVRVAAQDAEEEDIDYYFLELDANGAAVEDGGIYNECYEVSYEIDEDATTITNTPIAIPIEIGDEEFDYNGTPRATTISINGEDYDASTAGEYGIAASTFDLTLPEGYMIKVVPQYGEDDPDDPTSITHATTEYPGDSVGEAIPTHTTVQIFKPNGTGGYTDVTAKFTAAGGIDITEGSLTVNPLPITVTTQSATKAYDGEPLTKDGETVTGLLTGETVTTTSTGEQYLVGESENTYELEWDGTALEGDYYIDDEVLGMLTVTEPTEDTYVIEKTHDESDISAGDELEFYITVTNVYEQDVNLIITDVDEDIELFFFDGEDWAPVINPYEIEDVESGDILDFLAVHTVTVQEALQGIVENSVSVEFDIDGETKTYEDQDEASIEPLEIIVDMTGGEWTYDGTSHSATEEVTGLPEGFTYEITTTEVTDATSGEIDTETTVTIYDEDGIDVTDLVSLEINEGTLQVDPAQLKIRTASGQKVFDGTALTKATKDDYEIEGIVEGEDPDVSLLGTQTYIGVSENEYELVWPEGVNPDNYEIIEEELGELEVTPPPESGDDDPDPQGHTGDAKVVTKIHDNKVYEEGDVITFTIEVKNIYAAVKTIVVEEQPGMMLIDAAGKRVKSIEWFEVASGVAHTVTAEYTVTAADIEAGKIDNTVTVTFSGETRTYKGTDSLNPKKPGPGPTPTPGPTTSPSPSSTTSPAPTSSSNPTSHTSSGSSAKTGDSTGAFVLAVAGAAAIAVAAGGFVLRRSRKEH